MTSGTLRAGTYDLDSQFLPVHPETLTAEGKWYLNRPQMREIILLLGAGRRLGHRAVMPATPASCGITSCLQGDWRYQPAQGSVRTQIRWLCPREHGTGNFTGDAPTGLPQASREVGKHCVGRRKKNSSGQPLFMMTLLYSSH